MGPTVHLITSIVVTGISYAATDSPVIATATLCTGVLLDGDHLFDCGYYILHEKCGWKLSNPKEIFGTEYGKEREKIFIPLHSWELLIPLWLVSLAWLSIPLAIWLTVAFLTHIMIDQFSNHIGGGNCLCLSFFIEYFFCHRLAEELVDGLDSLLLSNPGDAGRLNAQRAHVKPLISFEESPIVTADIYYQSSIREMESLRNRLGKFGQMRA